MWYQVEKFHIRKEVAEYLKKGISKDKLTLLKFTYAESKTKLKWEHSREFEYQNQMYDIVEIDYKNDSVYYWCWLDKEETEINNEIKKVAEFVIPVRSKDSNHNKSEKDPTQNLYCAVLTKEDIFLNKKNLNFIDINSHYSSLHYSPLVPPPKEH